jgi:Arc/MetJ-type ribon-helix-helix transcriptional regulator
MRGNTMEKESRTITLPRTLVEKIEEKIKNSKYTSVSSYVEEVVKEILTAEEMEVGSFSREERALIRKKLKDLGYLE